MLETNDPYMKSEDEYDLLDLDEEESSLSKLHLLIESVFFPMLNNDRNKAGRTVAGETEVSDFETSPGEVYQVLNPVPTGTPTIIPQGSLNLDFVNNFKKFNQHIAYMIHQLSGDVTIEIPDVVIYDVKVAAEDEQVSTICLGVSS